MFDNASAEKWKYVINTTGLVLDIGIMSSVFANGWGRPGFNPRLSHTKDSKIVLDATLLNIQHYKVRIKGKVEQSRERSSAHS